MQIAVIFGAADPEREAAIRLCQDAGVSVHYATVGGSQVTPGNAYQADGITPPLPEGDVRVVRFECDGPAIPKEAEVVDHHRPGDPGYGRGPGDFLPASSIGHLLAILIESGQSPLRPAASGCRCIGYHQNINDQWVYGLSVFRKPDPSSGDDGDCGWDVLVPIEIVFVAAADHCLEAAYRGRCPGVDPDALMRWRAESRAAFQKRSVEELLADVGAARHRLRMALAGEFADLRGESIPELPEAAAREGIPFIADQEDRLGRKKVVLMAAPPELVRRFLDGEICPDLVDRYGDSARGFAGGYYPC